MKPEPFFKLSAEQKTEIGAALKKYCSEELEVEIGDLQADLFTSFLNEQIGKYYYNRGVTDTIAELKNKTEDLVLLLQE